MSSSSKSGGSKLHTSSWVNPAMRRSPEPSLSVSPSVSTSVFLQSGCHKSWISLINNVCGQMESAFLHVWGHTFPFFDLQVSALKALVQGLGHGFVVWVVVLSEIGVSQSFGSGYSLVRVQNQHLLKEVHSLKTTEHFICEPSTVDKHWTLPGGDILTRKLLKTKVSLTQFRNSEHQTAR